MADDPRNDERRLCVTIEPAATGLQLVRLTVPLAPGFLYQGEGLWVGGARDEGLRAAVRALTWHPSTPGPHSVRRVIVTFPYEFAALSPVALWLEPLPAAGDAEATFGGPVVALHAGGVQIARPGGAACEATFDAPEVTDPGRTQVEWVESNAYYLWQRLHVDDPRWPRVLEVRADALGGVVLVGHLQRRLAGDGYAPDLGWRLTIPGSRAALEAAGSTRTLADAPLQHTFQESDDCALLVDGHWRAYSPSAPLRRRGRADVARHGAGGVDYRYARCLLEHERVPMQEMAWHRAEVVIAPAGAAMLSPTLRGRHRWRVGASLWDALYGCGEPVETGQPLLQELLAYHHEVTARSAAVGDDWGNVTAFSDVEEHGLVHGMNRLNHCPPIFEEGYRSGDDRLLETAVAWCDNFYDQTIWWGEPGFGGTRYNNVIALGRTPPDGDAHYMWRSNRAVDFCTKGFDALLVAYEETGDPRMWEALQAQVTYTRESVHADDPSGKTRNVGVARDLVRLYRYTGDATYLHDAWRLFHELCAKLSTGKLFAESGRPLVSELPFIDEDAPGYKHPFAKPYILGYALESLPWLAEHDDDSELRAVIEAVADYVAASQDPLGGWRYPHPRSSGMIMSQAIEHAWQLALADRVVGPKDAYLEAIERALRQRIHVWLRTGRLFSYLTGWERASGLVADSPGVQALYERPEQRDGSRDYAEGRAELGNCPPDGFVYFADVLRYYAAQRPLSRLLAAPDTGDPLGQVLASTARRTIPSSSPSSG